MERKLIKFQTLDSLISDDGNYSIKEDVTEKIKTEKETESNNINKPKKKKFLISCKNMDRKDTNKINEKKLLFLVHKRKHTDDNKEKEYSNKTIIYRKHDRNEKDNIIKIIQIHYRNFLLSFTNDIIKKIIVEEFYNNKKLDKIINIKEYLFNNIDHHFKSKTKKEEMKLAESMKIKDTISPSISLCKRFNIVNKNLNIMKKIEELNNPILNAILNSEYLYYFQLYYNSNKKINIRVGELNYEFEPGKNVKLFNDLIEKDKKDQKYISKLKKFAELNFCKNKIGNNEE